ncbi:MAG: hypothetical protein Q4A41_02265, partial [Bacillota bacterium]|nr:hypothetical protein [Bacillota bacterium]
ALPEGVAALPEQDAASSSSSSSSSDIAFVPYFAQETLAKAKRPSFAENMYALAMGTEAHRELERFDFRSLLEMSEEEIENAQFSKRKVVNRFLKSAFARRIARADEIYKEADFVDDTGSGKLQGIIDLFFIEDGKIILVDYKTDVYREERVFDSDVAGDSTPGIASDVAPGAAPDSVPTAENDAKKVSLEEIVKRYKPQLKRYKEVLERVYEKEVSEVYLYLLHGQGRLEALSFE